MASIHTYDGPQKSFGGVLEWTVAFVNGILENRRFIEAALD